MSRIGKLNDNNYYLQNKTQLRKGDVFSKLLCIFSVSMQILLLTGEGEMHPKFSFGQILLGTIIIPALSWLLQDLLQG